MVEATKSEVLTGNDSSYESELLSPKAQIKELEATSQEPAQPEKIMTAREKIAKKGAECLPDGARILVHSNSRTVLATLKEAHDMKKRFFVYVTECASNDSGRLMKRDLESIGIPCTLVLDSSVGYILEQGNLLEGIDDKTVRRYWVFRFRSFDYI